MGFFSTLLGLDENKKSKIKDGINIMEAINAHVFWKVRLEKYVNGTSQEELDPKIICRDDQCVLGKWIHGPGQDYFHDDNEFKVLREDHTNFHIVAGRIVEHVQSNDRAKAEGLMSGRYMLISHKMVHDLTELNKQLLT